MKKLGKQYVIPVMVIAVGIGWLLNVHDLIPKVDWIWTIVLAAAGILMLTVGGLDKLTFVAGPFLIISSICSVLRQTGRLDLNKEVPILTIIFGVLLLAANMLKLPSPSVTEKKE